MHKHLEYQISFKFQIEYILTYHLFKLVYVNIFFSKKMFNFRKINLEQS
jgi:hypothetical protein